MISYQEIRSISPNKAREIIRRCLLKKKGNVSAVARSLHIHPKTVRRARDGTLEDQSKRPHTSPKRTDSELENIIRREGIHTGYRYRRLSHFLKNKYQIVVNENTVKAILKRYAVPRKTIRTKNKRVRHLYDYEHLTPFAEMQLDTKHILDQNALPTKIYEHILMKNLPRYEWNIIDAATRTRFMAYSHELSATFGFLFVSLVLLWLRAHNVRCHIHIQADNGMEFCAGSSKKEALWNEQLSFFDASFSSIPAGKHYFQALVENSHRHDDEQFLSIHPIRCNTDDQFITKAQRWQDTWNTARPSWGIAMNGITPLQKLKQKSDLITSHIFHFPVLLLENLLQFTTGYYVPTNYHYNKNNVNSQK